MSTPEPSTQEKAPDFTPPRLTELIGNPLYSEVWADPALSPRDRSIATVPRPTHYERVTYVALRVQSFRLARRPSNP